MHYYKKNIGDYATKAARLSMLQHGAYMLLMDACYDREKFPTKDEAIEWLWASSPEEIAAIEFVLNKFFVLNEDDHYEQSRIKQEIEKYHKNAATNKRIAVEREANRKGKSTKRARTVYEPPPNQELRTKNKEPITNKPKTNGDYSPEFESIWILYGRKGGKHVSNKSYAKLPQSTRNIILAHIPNYVLSTPDKQYRKNFETYLNQQAWNNEIILPDDKQPQDVGGI